MEGDVNGRATNAFLDNILEINKSTENKTSSGQDQDSELKGIIQDVDISDSKPVGFEDIIPDPDPDPEPMPGPEPEPDPHPHPDKDQKKKEILEEDKLDQIISYFKKIKNSQNPNISDNGYDKEYGWFHCGKQNEANGSTCELGKEMCPNCMKKTQELYKLKPHYLINSNGRICTYKKNKMYCLCKLTRVELNTKSKDDKQNGINYSIAYTCGHTGQCEPCKHLTSIMDKYFDANLMKKLKKRDETDLN